MRATIDKAGRLVIPKPLRERFGLGPGPVEISPTDTGIVVEPVETEALDDRRGRTGDPGFWNAIDDDLVRSLRQADQM
jgi:AbrB family looped-hinge helix DNA binding protein